MENSHISLLGRGVSVSINYHMTAQQHFAWLCSRVATGNPVVFTLTPPECYMEIRYGYGTSGNRVTSAVRVGDPLTLIIYMRSKYGTCLQKNKANSGIVLVIADGFDIVVNDCFAHNGATKKIQLIDEYG